MVYDPRQEETMLKPEWRTRRRVLAGGAVAGTAALLASCGVGRSPAPEVKATGKVLYVLSSGSSSIIPHRQSQAAAFGKKYPNLQVEVSPVDPGTDGYDRKVQVMQASGTPPEAFESGAVRVPELATNGQAFDMTPYLKHDKVDLNDFYPALLKAWSWQGKQVALNDFWDTALMYVNRDLITRAGLKLPDVNTTYEQWLDMAKKMTAAEGSVWGGHMSPNLPVVFNNVWAAGGEVFSADGKKCVLDAQVATDALQWQADLYAKHQAAPPPSYLSVQGQGSSALFAAGKLAMGLDAAGGDLARTFSQAQNLNFVMVPVPKGSKGRANWMFANTTHIADNAKNRDGAWAFVRWMTSTEGYDARSEPEGNRSVHPSQASSPRLTANKLLADRGVLQAWKDSEATLHQPPQVTVYQTATGQLASALGPVWSGQKTAKQAISEVLPTINDLLAKG
jgi:multiple sugar transport system substrate-binding protein